MTIRYAVNRFRALYNYHHKKTRVGNYPLIHNIEITNACNLNCVFCVRSDISRRGIGYMSEDLFNKIINTYTKSIENIRLFFHGEPLLHPKLCQFIKQVKLVAKSVGITTNATLLTPEYAEKLIRSGLDIIAISFEGFNKEIYESLRRGANFDSVNENIRNLLRIRKEINSNIHVTIVAVLIDSIARYIDDFMKYWRLEGVDDIQIIDLHDWGGMLNVEYLAWAGIKIQRNNPVCIAPWIGVHILWNGDIVPCCAWEFGALGNISKISLYDLWNSKVYVDFRRLMLTDREKLPCQSCNLNPYLNIHIDTIEPYYPLSRSFVKQFVLKKF